MTDFDHAFQRLTVWIRDYGDQKQPVFIADLSIVLSTAKDAALDAARWQWAWQNPKEFWWTVQQHGGKVALDMIDAQVAAETEQP